MKVNDFMVDRRRSHRIMSSPVQKSSLTFDDLYQEISDHWEDKARRLQARRWRKIKHQAI